MNKNELTDQIAERTDLTKGDAGKALDAALDIIAETLGRGSDVAIAGFGKFTVSERGERQGRNPATGEAITIAASKSPKFAAAKALKDAVK